MSRDTAQERSEKPTQKRKRESKEKGQLLRSKELNSALVVFLGGFALWIFGGRIVKGLLEILHHSFSVPRDALYRADSTWQYLRDALTQMMHEGWPFLLALMFVSTLGALFVGGWSVSLQSLKPKFDRMNPISGLKRIFSTRGLMELLKAILKVLFVFLFFLAFSHFTADRILTLHLGNTEQGILISVKILTL